VDEVTKMGTADLIWIGHNDECAVLVTDGTRNAREVLQTFEDHVARGRHESAIVLLSPAEARKLAGKLLGSARLAEARCRVEGRDRAFRADAALSDVACGVFDGE
jgi:hypothetical protein